MANRSRSASSRCRASIRTSLRKAPATRITAAQRATFAELIEELKKEKIDGLVLDLRHNGGGYLPEATALTGLFVDKGPVVQLKDTTGRLEVLDDPEPGVEYDGPLAVLINRSQRLRLGNLCRRDPGLSPRRRHRASARSARARCRTWYRWIAGQQRPVNGQLTVTIGKFYRVTGESTQHRGVEPDVQLPSGIDMKTVGESALEAALPWDRIPGVAFRTAVRNADTSISALDAEEKLRAAQGPGLSLAGADDRVHRPAARAEDDLPESQRPQGRTRRAGCAEPGSRERPPWLEGHAGPEECRRAGEGKARGARHRPRAGRRDHG